MNTFASVIDRAIEAIAPGLALKRAGQRHAVELMRSYEGASRGRRMTNWRTRPTNANAETLSLPLLRDRMRDLVRNNSYAARAVQVIANNMIGTGILAQASGDGSDRKQALWRDWAESTQCDADGRHNLYGLQLLAARTVAEAGECLVRRRWRRVSDGLAVPMQLQVLEGDHLDVMKDGALPGGGYMVQGVEFNAFGKRVAYWLYRDHPGSPMGFRADSVRVPADEIIHLYRVDRPGQVRGIPWGAPTIVRMRDLADWQDNKLFRAKLAACFTAFVTDADGIGAPVSDDATTPLEQLEPGAIEYLPPGKDVTFAAPPPQNGDENYTIDQLRAIAVAWGITYDALTGDLSGFNFSSGRMGWIEFHRNVESWRWNMVIPQMLNPIWSWFNDAAELMGYGRNGVTWTPPRREMIDPVKETAAMKQLVRSGFCSLSEAIRLFGYDPDEVLEELSKDFAKLDKLGLTLDVDPRVQLRAKTGGTANA